MKKEKGNSLLFNFDLVTGFVQTCRHGSLIAQSFIPFDGQLTPIRFAELIEKTDYENVLP